MTAGYSGTPLAKKLGVRDGQRTWRSGMPASVAAEIERGGVTPVLLEEPAKRLEMTHIFVTRRADFARALKRVRAVLRGRGAVHSSRGQNSRSL